MIARAPRPGETSPSHTLPAQPGAGLEMITNRLGTAYSAPRSVSRYGHPWTPSLSSKTLTLSWGLVNGTITPKIGDLPMTDPKAVLKLSADKVNANGESWAVLEVEPNADGLLDAKSRIEIVQLSEVIYIQKTIGRLALALILFQGKSPFFAKHIVHFNVNYQRQVPPAGSGPTRHLFT